MEKKEYARVLENVMAFLNRVEIKGFQEIQAMNEVIAYFQEEKINLEQKVES